MIMIVGVVKVASLKQSDCSGKTHCSLIFLHWSTCCAESLSNSPPPEQQTSQKWHALIGIVDGNTSMHWNFVETKEMIKGTGHDESQGLGWDVSMLWSWYRSDCWTVIAKVWICGPWVYCFSAAMIRIQPRFGMWTFTWSLWIELDSNMQAHGVFLILSFLRWAPCAVYFGFWNLDPVPRRKVLRKVDSIFYNYRRTIDIYRLSTSLALAGDHVGEATNERDHL